MLLAVLFIRAQSGNHPNVPQLMNGQTERDGSDSPHIRIYSSVERKEVLARATTWMNLENIRLSEGARRKTTSCIISLVRNIQKQQIHTDKN